MLDIAKNIKFTLQSVFQAATGNSDKDLSYKIEYSLENKTW